MARCDRLGFLLLLALGTFLTHWRTAWASYDTAQCDQHTQSAKKDLETPHFYTDFTVLSERTATLSDQNTSTESVVHEQLWYLSTFRQALKYEETPAKWSWLLVDEIPNECLYKELGGTCQSTCSGTTNEFLAPDGRLDIGTYYSALKWLRPTNKEASLDSEGVRGITSRKYVTCYYDQALDTTTVSIWHTLDPFVYPNMDDLKSNLLMAHHKKYKDSEQISDERIDYTDYKQLLASEVPNGLQIGEGQCGHIEGNFRSIQPPNPSLRHGFVSEADITPPQGVQAKARFSFYEEYNYNSQILFTVYALPDAQGNEVETTIEAFDFSAKHTYTYSLTKGNCQVTPGLNYRGSDVMPLPQEYWRFRAAKEPSYLGVYMNRGIPCNTWLFEYPEGGEESDTITLYLATPEWLETRALPRDMFYPIQRISRMANENIFESFYQFKDNPGYHIPQLQRCFKQDDVKVGKITLEKTNYFKVVVPNKIHFEYEFRQFIQKTTGIKSHMRVTGISAAPAKNIEETDVTFMIMGEFVNTSGSDPLAYVTDPVTSQQAVDKISQAVEKGDFKFSLDKLSVTLHLKKGSFSVLKNYDHFENVARPESAASSGYSQVAMAAVSLTLLLLSLLIALLAVLAYKRRSEGQNVLPTFSMKKLSNGN
ncbi:hypothetical protein EGW08_000162 [Elysia chlorotica]|uniref:LolA-like domain-containing protein n=1 Tax=Elysia chlorotica TaxID=188477 RepID=A0A433UED6_ELYCH|nr:hypothetical protein EGW08_000162 [Elysia chlorotica]